MSRRNFGLIGKTLKHSFSKKYFTEKFEKENISDASYELFELENIGQIQKIFDLPGLEGFNITIPYKEEIKPFLHSFDKSAEKVGAVNVVKILKNGHKIGYNSDYYGFKTSLENWADLQKINQALVLGTGGASKAVIASLEDLGILPRLVSRSKNKGSLTYDDLRNDPEIVRTHKLIINCTPLGTYPDVQTRPEINYDQITTEHFLYDLVYNPEITAFMQEGINRGAKAKNGLEMLILQAEKSWEIWNC